MVPVNQLPPPKNKKKSVQILSQKGQKGAIWTVSLPQRVKYGLSRLIESN